MLVHKTGNHASMERKLPFSSKLIITCKLLIPYDGLFRISLKKKMCVIEKEGQECMFEHCQTDYL